MSALLGSMLQHGPLAGHVSALQNLNAYTLGMEPLILESVNKSNLNVRGWGLKGLRAKFRKLNWSWPYGA